MEKVHHAFFVSDGGQLRSSTFWRDINQLPDEKLLGLSKKQKTKHTKQIRTTSGKEAPSFRTC